MFSLFSYLQQRHAHQLPLLPASGGPLTPLTNWRCPDKIVHNWMQFHPGPEDRHTMEMRAESQVSEALVFESGTRLSRQLGL